MVQSMRMVFLITRCRSINNVESGRAIAGLASVKLQE